MTRYNKAEWDKVAGKHGVTLHVSVGEAYGMAEEAEKAGCWRIAARIYRAMLGGPVLTPQKERTFACPICGLAGLEHAAAFHAHIIDAHGDGTRDGWRG